MNEYEEMYENDDEDENSFLINRDIAKYNITQDHLNLSLEVLNALSDEEQHNERFTEMSGLATKTILRYIIQKWIEQGNATFRFR